MKKLAVNFLFSVLVIGIAGSAMAYSIMDDATGGDCTLIGIWDSETKTCTLTADLYNLSYGIRIGSSAITLDGNGHTISGINKRYSKGVNLSWGKTGVAIKNLNIKNFHIGIYLLSYSNSNTITNNIISNNSDGIRFYYYSNSNVITNNIFSDNHNGLYIGYSNNNTLDNNIVSGNDLGIYIKDSGGNTITNNTVLYNNLGIRIGSGADNKIYNNNFIDNQQQAFDRWAMDIFNLDAPIGGNYWSNYDTPEEGCYDTNSDGFCDTPYTVYVSRILTYWGPITYKSIDYLPWTRQDGWRVAAVIDVEPDTLNRKSKSSKNAVTVYIEIPDHDINQININSITLNTNNGSVSVQSSPSEIGDYDNDGIPDLMVKFNRQEVMAIVDIGEAVEIKIAGNISNKIFKGSDEIKVIE